MIGFLSERQVINGWEATAWCVCSQCDSYATWTRPTRRYDDEGCSVIYLVPTCGGHYESMVA